MSESQIREQVTAKVNRDIGLLQNYVETLRNNRVSEENIKKSMRIYLLNEKSNFNIAYADYLDFDDNMNFIINESKLNMLITKKVRAQAFL